MKRHEIIFKIIISFVFLFSHPLWAGTSLNLQDTLQLAENQSPSLGSKKNILRIRELEKKNAFSGFLPQLDFKSEHGMFDKTSSAIRPDYTSSMGLYLTQTIYDNHATILAYENASLSYDIAKLQYENERDQLFLKVASAYFDYSLAVKLTEVQNTQLSIISKQFQTLQAQYQQGLKTRRDYLRFKGDLRRSEIDVQNAKASLSRSVASIYQLIGLEQVEASQQYQVVPLEIDYKLVAVVPTVAPDLSQHYFYRMRPLQKELFQNTVYAAQRDYWPVVSLQAGGFHAYDNYLGPHKTPFADADTTGWSAGLTVSWNLWDWGVRSRKIQIATEERQQSERAVAETINEFSAQSEFNMISLQQSAGNFNLGKELLEMESTNYNFLEREYRNGTVSYLDLITSLRNLLGAKITVYTNYFELRNQILKYRYYEGTLNDYLQKK